MVDSSTFGSEFTPFRNCIRVGQINSLQGNNVWFSLYETANVLCDNESLFKNNNFFEPKIEKNTNQFYFIKLENVFHTVCFYLTNLIMITIFLTY